jgi:hypothetical protein
MVPIDKTNVNQVQEDYISILGELIEEGVPYEEAKSKAQKRSLLLHEELEVHRESYSLDKISLRKIVSFRNICFLPTVAKKGGWESLSIAEKKTILWELGLDSKDYGWKTEVGYHREAAGNLVFDKYVMSNERTDIEWINLIVEGKRVSSLEAQLEASGDKSLYIEIGRLGG